MSQITIHIDDQLELKLISMATKVNFSLDRFVANLLEQRVNNGWSPITASLVGAWAADEAIQLVQPVNSVEVHRESL
jgi:hypothetical protein